MTALSARKRPSKTTSRTSTAEKSTNGNTPKHVHERVHETTAWIREGIPVEKRGRHKFDGVQFAVVPDPVLEKHNRVYLYVEGFIFTLMDRGILTRPIVDKIKDSVTRVLNGSDINVVIQEQQRKATYTKVKQYKDLELELPPKGEPEDYENDDSDDW